MTREHVDMNDLVQGYPVTIEFPIKWGEMDAYQHLNNTVYFRYFEDARIAYFDKIELGRLKEESGIGPILASTQCKFRLPLAYPDRVTVASRISRLEVDRFVMDYLVVSHRHRKVAASGDGVLVAFDYNAGKKATVPDSLRRRIIAIEGSGIVAPSE
jgi:acyl-CoA thioester hydrolase